jgi:archaemetzincin
MDMKNLIILSLILMTSCQTKNKKANDDLIKTLAINDLSLSTPAPGEWLFNHPEKGQTFEAYKKCKPISATAQKNKLYLLPIGNFDSKSQNLIQTTANYLSIFYGLTTIILPTQSNDIFPDSIKRTGYSSGEQLFAPYILNHVLKKILPVDAIGIMAITENDIYPSNDFNFVFGLSSFRDRVSVTSMYRLSENEHDTINKSTCLNRLTKIAAHEIGHMFTMHHCTHAKCLMNGSNGLYETDGKPNKLCSVCTAKINWNLNLNTKKRLQLLMSFFRKNHLKNELNLIEKDYALLDQ